MKSKSFVTIGIIPRERFSLTADTIQKIVECTSVPYRLIVIDCNIPEPYRKQIERALPLNKSVEVMRFDRYLLPNVSRNHVVAESDDEFVCLIDNDVLVEPGWLDSLVARCKEQSVRVVRPAVFKHGKIHFDCTLGPVSTAVGVPGYRKQIGTRTESNEFDPASPQRPVEWLEMHCLLFRRSVFSVIGPLDERLNTREHVDLSLALRSERIPIVFEPASCVHFFPPPPIRRNEREFFYFRWDVSRAVASNARVKTKWNLAHYQSNINWVIGRQARVNRLRHFFNEALRPPALVSKLPGRVTRELNERRKRWKRSAARRRFGSLPGLESGPLRVPINEKDTRYIRAGSVTFGVEKRLPRHNDSGVSLHVFSEHSGGRLVERFRVDCLHDSPHYHYVFQDQGINQKFLIDPLVVEDTQGWALDFIRRSLPEIFATVAPVETTILVDKAEIERVLPQVERAMRRATDWRDDREIAYQTVSVGND